MTCSRCSNARVVWLDDDTVALGGLTVPCGRCCCKDCGSLLDAPWGYCAFGCRLREEYRTASAWVEAAARMHFGAGTSQNVALANSSCGGGPGEIFIKAADKRLIKAAPEMADALVKAEALIESARVLAIANGNAASERALMEGLPLIRAALRKAGRLP